MGNVILIGVCAETEFAAYRYVRRQGKALTSFGPTAETPPGMLPPAADHG
jgi:hypothetical protein